LTTTQRMKEFRTAHSESVVKERERKTSRPNPKTSLRPSGVVARMLFLSESKKQRFHKKIPLYLHP